MFRLQEETVGPIVNGKYTLCQKSKSKGMTLLKFIDPTKDYCTLIPVRRI
jgi:hypothetical protein